MEIIYYVAIILLILMSLLIFSSFYLFLDKKKKYKGIKIDIGGYKLHMFCKGQYKSKEPIAIFDAGRGCNHLAWSAVQDLTSKFIRTVSYDRAGLGWSDVSPYERTSSNIIKEMKYMLDKAEIPKPYILIGHSFGGVNVLLYACAYPQDVYGIILVDSCHEDQLEKLPKIKETILSNIYVQKFFNFIGINQLLYFFKKDIDLNSDIDWGLYGKYVDRKYFSSFYDEYNLFKKSLRQLKDIDQKILFDKFLTVISAGYNKNSSNDWFKVWLELQKDFVKKSKNGIQLIAEDSDHMIVKTNPQIISNAINEMYQSYIKDMKI